MGNGETRVVYGSDIVATDWQARVKLLASLLAAGLGAAGLLAAAPRSVSAQQDAAKSKAMASGLKTKATAPSQPARAPNDPQPKADDSAARKQILNSPKWQETMQQFEKWLSRQRLYDAQEVEHVSSRLKVGIGRMTAAQLQWFLNDMEEKLEVLTGQEARDASDYLTETAAVSSPTYARQLRQKRPDLLTMTAAQVHQKLAALAYKRQAASQMQQLLQESRLQRIARNKAQLAGRGPGTDRDLDRESTAASSTTKGNKSPAAHAYFPNADNDRPLGRDASVDFGGGGFF